MYKAFRRSLCGVALNLIKKLVGTEEPLDLKSREFKKSMELLASIDNINCLNIPLNNYRWSIWSRQWNNPQKEDDDSLIMEKDFAGNYLYGYFGSGFLDGIPFQDEILLYGAGAAQGLSDKNLLKWLKSMISDNYGDNKNDPEMIKEGINAYWGD